MLRRAITTVPLYAEFYQAASPRPVRTLREAVHRNVAQQAQARSTETNRAHNIVVLAHGLLGTSRNFAAVATGLTRSFSTENNNLIACCVDMRNHGNSPHSSEHTLSSLVADLDAFLEAEISMLAADGDVRIDKVALCAHSMSGRATVHGLATLAAEQQRSDADVFLLPAMMKRPLDGAIIVDIRHDAPPPTGKIELMFRSMAVINQERAVKPEAKMTIARANKLLAQAGVEAGSLRQYILNNFVEPKDASPLLSCWKCNFDVLDRGVKDGSLFASPFDNVSATNTSSAPRIETPTLFVYGEQSEFNDSEARKRIPERFAHSQQVVIPNAGHFVHNDNFSAFMAAMAEFLSSRGFR